MSKLTFVVCVLLVLLLSACNGQPPETSTPSATSTRTATAMATPSSTETPTATITPTVTDTPIQFQSGKISTPGPFAYYFDPSLRNSKGNWEGVFYICTRYLNYDKRYDGFEIAADPVDCINRTVLGWVQGGDVILGTGNYNGFMTFIPPGAKQCANGLDDDRDGMIDHPADPHCENVSDDWEDEKPPIPPVVVPPPDKDERVKITMPKNGTEVHCNSEDTCGVGVRVNWLNPTPGNKLCIFVQPKETNNQPYYYQPTGTAYIGPAKNNTIFEIIAVSTSLSCSTGSSLPPGNQGSVDVKRINND